MLRKGDIIVVRYGRKSSNGLTISSNFKAEVLADERVHRWTVKGSVPVKILEGNAKRTSGGGSVVVNIDPYNMGHSYQRRCPGDVIIVFADGFDIASSSHTTYPQTSDTTTLSLVVESINPDTLLCLLTQ